MPFTRVELCALSVVQGRLCALLIRRGAAPSRGAWALPGGALRIDLDASLEAAAQRVASERLGSRLPCLRQQCATGGKARDPRAPWTLAVVYQALLPHEAIRPVAGKRVDAWAWVPVEDIADQALAFDHAELVRRCVASLRQDVEDMNLPFEAFPEIFTLGELQHACELLLGRPLDKSSFRRKVDARGLVEAVEGEMRTGANRPAQLFRQRRASRPAQAASSHGDHP